jgi:hypothetical protein
MLWTISVIFAIVWLVAMTAAVTFNGHIHIFLALAAGTILVRLFPRRRAID